MLPKRDEEQTIYQTIYLVLSEVEAQEWKKELEDKEWEKNPGQMPHNIIERMELSFFTTRDQAENHLRFNQAKDLVALPLSLPKSYLKIDMMNKATLNTAGRDNLLYSSFSNFSAPEDRIIFNELKKALDPQPGLTQSTTSAIGARLGATFTAAIDPWTKELDDALSTKSLNELKILLKNKDFEDKVKAENPAKITQLVKLLHTHRENLVFAGKPNLITPQAITQLALKNADCAFTLLGGRLGQCLATNYLLKIKDHYQNQDYPALVAFLGKLLEMRSKNKEPEQPDPYQVLGVSRDAGTAEIKKAYHEMSLVFHPDKMEIRAKEAEKEGNHDKAKQIREDIKKNQFSAIFDAKELLLNTERRKQWNAEHPQVAASPVRR